MSKHWARFVLAASLLSMQVAVACGSNSGETADTKSPNGLSSTTWTTKKSVGITKYKFEEVAQLPTASLAHITTLGDSIYAIRSARGTAGAEIVRISRDGKVTGSAPIALGNFVQALQPLEDELVAVVLRTRADDRGCGFATIDPDTLAMSPSDDSLGGKMPTAAILCNGLRVLVDGQSVVAISGGTLAVRDGADARVRTAHLDIGANASTSGLISSPDAFFVVYQSSIDDSVSNMNDSVLRLDRKSMEVTVQRTLDGSVRQWGDIITVRHYTKDTTSGTTVYKVSDTFEVDQKTLDTKPVKAAAYETATCVAATSKLQSTSIDSGHVRLRNRLWLLSGLSRTIGVSIDECVTNAFAELPAAPEGSERIPHLLDLDDELYLLMTYYNSDTTQPNDTPSDLYKLVEE